MFFKFLALVGCLYLLFYTIVFYTKEERTKDDYFRFLRVLTISVTFIVIIAAFGGAYNDEQGKMVVGAFFTGFLSLYVCFYFFYRWILKAFPPPPPPPEPEPPPAPPPPPVPPTAEEIEAKITELLKQNKK